MDFENVQQHIILDYRRLQDLPRMSNKILVVADQIWVISDDAKAQELHKELDELLSLLKCLVQAQIVIIIRPRLVIQS